MIRIENVSKGFRRGFFNFDFVPVLRDISFDIPEGSAVGLMGASGSGKSTLGRIILGLAAADSGHVFYDGADISGFKKEQRKNMRRRMQILFQNPESVLNPRMTIRQNMLEPVRIHKLYSPGERGALMRRTFQMVGLSEKLMARYPREISGGEAQRVNIARTLTLSPRFILLDEPTSMLDLSVQAQILNLLKNLQRELRFTYLFISHDLEVVRWFSDKVYFLKNGFLSAASR